MARFIFPTEYYDDPSVIIKDGCQDGWLSPDGFYYPCPHMGSYDFMSVHDWWANRIMKDSKIDLPDKHATDGDFFEYTGWIKIETNKVLFRFRRTGKYASDRCTQAQYDKLFDLSQMGVDVDLTDWEVL